MRILRLSITALVALVAVSAAILLTARIQEEPPQREVSMTAPAGTASTTTTTRKPTTTTTTTAPTTTTAAPTTTTTAYVAPTTTAAPVYEPEPTYPPEPVYEEPEPVYEEEPSYPAGAGCVIPAYICAGESGHSYTALNSSSGAGGMYQFMPSTWDAIARQIAPEWVGTPPHTAPPHVQDQFALYLWDGGRGCYHWSVC